MLDCKCTVKEMEYDKIGLKISIIRSISLSAPGSIKKLTQNQVAEYYSFRLKLKPKIKIKLGRYDI